MDPLWNTSRSGNIEEELSGQFPVTVPMMFKMNFVSDV